MRITYITLAYRRISSLFDVTLDLLGYECRVFFSTPSVLLLLHHLLFIHV